MKKRYTYGILFICIHFFAFALYPCQATGEEMSETLLLLWLL